MNIDKVYDFNLSKCSLDRISVSIISWEENEGKEVHQSLCNQKQEEDRPFQLLVTIMDVLRELDITLETGPHSFLWKLLHGT